MDMKMKALLVVCGLVALSFFAALIPMSMSSLPTHAMVIPLTEAPDIHVLRSPIVNNKNYWVTKRSLFFVEQTITIPIADIDLNPNTVYIVWETDVRPTKTNAVNLEDDLSNTSRYTHFFSIDKDIIINYRFPNTPIWYGIAAVSTAVAMGVFYLIIKARKETKTKPTVA